MALAVTVGKYAYALADSPPKFSTSRYYRIFY